MQDSAIDYSTIALIVLAFVAFLSIADYINGLSDGWLRLAGRFRSRLEPPANCKSLCIFLDYAHMDALIRLNFIQISVSQDALYLSSLVPMSVGHPSLRIPWSEIKVCGRDNRFVEFQLGLNDIVPFGISIRTARKLGILDRFPESNNMLRTPNFDTPSKEVVESMRCKSD